MHGRLLILAAVAGLMAAPAPAADADVRVLTIQVEVERRLLEAQGRRLLEVLDAERHAAMAVSAAADQASGSVRAASQPTASRPGAAPAMPVAEALSALQQAEAGLSGALGSARAQWAIYEAQLLRTGGMEAALRALTERGPLSRLDGTWDLTLTQQPPRYGQMRLSQNGTIVTGDYAMQDGATGNLSGTYTGGRLRLERIDAEAGRDMILEGELAGPRLQGTWLATIFGRGTTEAGQWAALKRGETVEPPAESPVP